MYLAVGALNEPCPGTGLLLGKIELFIQYMERLVKNLDSWIAIERVNSCVNLICSTVSYTHKLKIMSLLSPSFRLSQLVQEGFARMSVLLVLVALLIP